MLFAFYQFKFLLIKVLNNTMKYVCVRLIHEKNMTASYNSFIN
jgi:hypothetical protein